VHIVGPTAAAAGDSKPWMQAILPDLMRHVYQNFLLEERPQVIEATSQGIGGYGRVSQAS
jgi:hypothetical protein